ncbi:class I adenylate-forming enzyme family protein [Streptomyces sp. DT2A-34]|uniref:class I adenylate-forming enzyme family protein n=1 Tax=Streptomyces sp. DT2A-34 TaxID=3051182 RepID=UPI00265BAB64|nr:class I adenylate-forming enzyme family protein [Streptomyces sp. DT2A-34]MDO0912325.1 class I adenylate-forming enzyme family protein [Streptomyces sp. DT2A-34]
MPQQHPLLADRGFYLGPVFRRAADRHGAVRVTLDRPLDIRPDLGVDLSYPVLADVVEELAGRLWEAGVRPSEQVAVHKTDNVDIVLLTCAVSRVGAVPVLLSPALAGPVVAQLLGRLRRPWLITDRAKLDGPLKDAGVSGLVRRTLCVDGVDDAPGAEPLEKYAGAEPAAPVRLHPREPSLITHSSGTTGVPKLAVHCANTMWNRLVPQKAMGRPTRGETAALHMSFVHSRFYHLLGVLLHFGSPLVLITDPEPAAVAPLLVRHRPGIVETHPNTFVLWEELADAPGAPLSRVRSYGSTFDAIHPRTVRRLLDASRRRTPWLIQLYGQSETGPVAFQWFTRRSAARADGRRVGIGIPGFTRVRVTGPDGRRVAPGTPGRIEARTRGRILTYLGMRDRYDRQLTDGWWEMGDMGYQSRLGALYLIDREIDRIDSVHSNLEVEDMLMSRLEELREVVIVPGADREPVPVVCVRGEQPLDPERWREATADLPAMAEPRQWRFADLPMTATWKVKRVEITRMLAETEPEGAPA